MLGHRNHLSDSTTDTHRHTRLSQHWKIIQTIANGEHVF